MDAAIRDYGVGEGDGELLSFFLVVSFFMVESVDFLVEESVDDFLEVDDFLLIDSFLAGAFSGAVVVVDSDLVVQELMSPAANKAVME